jgi:large subunit ribosomal protein L2
MSQIPAGSIIHSISLDYKKESSLVRSAGTFCQIVQKSLNQIKIKLPSGSVISCPSTSFATLGSVSNFQHNLTLIGKAGKNRLLGKRPSVRGIAMNPVDHPHGGRTNGGMPSVTPWGIPTKGKPTVSKTKVSK